MENKKIKRAVMTAEIFKEQFKVEFNLDGVKFLDEYIENRREEINEEAGQHDLFLYGCGAFLGACLVENFEGNWQMDEGGLAVNINDSILVYPFVKVSKHFRNGSTDSILALYKYCAGVYNAEIQPPDELGVNVHFDKVLQIPFGKSTEPISTKEFLEQNGLPLSLLEQIGDKKVMVIPIQKPQNVIKKGRP